MKKNKKKVLVTGGSGFIGNHLINELINKGHEISSFDRKIYQRKKNIQQFQGDLLDKKVIEEVMKGQDVVYHLAGVLGTSELQSQAAQAAEINIVGTVRILDAAIKNKTKVVLISKPNPWLNTYSVTKEASEKFCQIYQKDFGLKAVIIKWFNVYGPGQRYGHVQKAVPTFIILALQNEPLPVFGSGQQQGDFVYVTDTAEMTIKLAENPKAEGRTIQIGTGKGTTVNKLAKMIIKMCNSKSKINYLPMRIGEAQKTYVVADLTELNKIDSFKPKINLNNGMKMTIDYYRNLLISQK